MCSLVNQHHAPDVLRERAIGMLTAGMSTRAVARELNVHFATISRLQHRPTGLNHRPHVTLPAQDPHIRLLHLQDHLGGGSWGVFLSVIKPFCGEELIWIDRALLPSWWAWLPSVWAYAQSCEIHRLRPNEFQLTDLIFMNCNAVQVLKWLDLYFCSACVSNNLDIYAILYN